LAGATGIKMGNGQQLVVTRYADDDIIMAKSEEDLKRTTRKLIKKGEKIGLMVNEGKTMYMIVTRHNHETRHLEVNNYNFERVANFKYLGVNIYPPHGAYLVVVRGLKWLFGDSKCYSNGVSHQQGLPCWTRRS